MLSPPPDGARCWSGSGNAVAGQQILDECAVLCRQQLPNPLRVDSALFGADILGRQQQVDPVRPTAGLPLDPGQFAVQPLGAVRDGAQDPEPTRVGHRRHDVAAVAEGADRELDAEHFGHSGPHGTDAMSY